MPANITAGSAEFYEKNGNFLVAGKLFEERMDWERACDCYEEAEAWEPLYRCSLKINDFFSAAHALERMGAWAKAAEAYDLAGHTERADNCRVRAPKLRNPPHYALKKDGVDENHISGTPTAQSKRKKRKNIRGKIAIQPEVGGDVGRQFSSIELSTRIKVEQKIRSIYSSGRSKAAAARVRNASGCSIVHSKLGAGVIREIAATTAFVVFPQVLGTKLYEIDVSRLFDETQFSIYANLPFYRRLNKPFIAYRYIHSRDEYRLKSSNDRNTHCYRCKAPLCNGTHEYCEDCQWLVCSCTACGCGYLW